MVRATVAAALLLAVLTLVRHRARSLQCDRVPPLPSNFHSADLYVVSQASAQVAPTASPSAENIVLKDLIVLCPINSTTEVQSLSIQSMEPTTTSTQTNTEYASYLYTSVNALGGITACTGAESVLASGVNTS